MISFLQDRHFLVETAQAKIIASYALPNSLFRMMVSSVLCQEISFPVRLDPARIKIKFPVFSTYLKIDDREYPSVLDLEDPISMNEITLPVNLHPKSVLEQDRHLFDFNSLFDQSGYRLKNHLCPICRREIEEVGLVLRDAEDRLEIKKTNFIYCQLIKDYKVENRFRKTVEFVIKLKDLNELILDLEILKDLDSKKEILKLKTSSSKCGLLFYGSISLIAEFIRSMKLLMLIDFDICLLILALMTLLGFVFYYQINH